VANNITDAGENLMLDWITATGSPTRPTGPKVALMTADGSDSAAGTEVTGGSYARQSVTFSAASAGSTSNTADLTFTSMPACTVTGVEIWDSGGTVRLWWGPLTASKVVNSGDPFTIPAGSLTLTLN
jgi:hypothetical protein